MSTPEELIAQADKKAKPVSGFSSLFSGSSTYRFEEAADLYVQAANQYKLQKNFSSAGKLFEKASESYLKASSPDEAGNILVESYKAYKNTSPADAARCLSKAIEHFTSRGQFRRAANFKCDLGDLYLLVNDKESAIKSFEDAGDWYSSDSAESLSNKSYLKAADLKAEMGNYIEAAETYEKIAEKSLSNNLTKWSTKDYFTKAILCRLASDDYPGAFSKLDLFVTWDRTFATTREFKFLNELLENVKDGDSEAIGKSCADYDQFSRLDNWKVSILTKIKDSVAGGGGNIVDGAGGEDDLT
ncbi:hypothetical protein PACTADRAFT_81012 [Pachysolen tannophilus NRRL Y-2460]|uniref:Vesicular-fusion protein SEC17 n=1 Tax=Pachysolen tannophilus NRRL Y-2460 TaxID=669874 RepID=A0A1E4TV65_PACTA|nr:hypothetical protein PACTADRAFT_81012 [Pachysolen tannophilus NRRL Y-2460]